MKFKSDDVLGSWKYFSPLALILFLVPILVRLNIVLATDTETSSWKKDTFYYDFFSYNKAKLLIILAVIALLFTIYALMMENIILKKSFIYIPMLAYALFIILSTIFSNYSHISIYGFGERYEGMLVLLTYLLIMFLAINVTNSNKTLVILVSTLIVSALIISGLGILQYINKDFFNTYIGKRLILPIGLSPDELNLSMSMVTGTLYGTLMNSNYVGSYMILILPIILCCIIYCKNKLFKIGFGVIFLITSFTMFGSNSRAGIVGIIFTAVFYLILRIKHIFKKKNIITLLLVVLLCFGLFIVLNKLTKNQMTNRFLAVFTEITEKKAPVKKTNVTDISLLNNSELKISKDASFLTLSLDKTALLIKDENNNKINYKIDNGNLILDNKTYESFNFKLSYYENKPLVLLKEGTLDTAFIWTDNTIKYLNLKSLMTYSIYPISHKYFEGRETLGSWRGYIWSTTLPMLKHTMFLGKGPDTFCIYFPQQDFIRRANIGLEQNIIIDKPHNMYMQVAFNTGMVSLVAMCSIFLIYFIQCFKIYFNQEINDIYSIVGLGICLSVFGYLIAAIFNDSTVGVSSVFWILIGCGVAINMKLRRNSKPNDELLINE